MAIEKYDFSREFEFTGKQGWTIETPSRLFRVGIDKIEFSREILVNDRCNNRHTILKLSGATGEYYEGIDHSEIILMLDDFERTNGVSGEKIILVNVDEHDDMESLIDHEGQWYKPNTVNEGNCICKAAKLNLCNSKIGLHWIFRRVNGDMALGGPDIELPETENFWIIDNFYDTGLRMHLLEFDAIATDKKCVRAMKKLFALKEKGFLIATSIDFDAGRQRDDNDYVDPDWETKLFPDEKYDRDLASTEWLLELCRNSATVMTFHSSYRYCDPAYAEDQGERFRHLCLNGYRANLPHLAGEVK